ncbi:hypothetical protein N7493_003772 [Penicillium malachiteum]|uniref:Uncharacterized protein n=1 Tax=Penicillium malachiteum TaxID=1324776 RepID=A0AAD6MXZ6_9EURO|nr:hypothetical protein N7493_003772 [Penicillium malachiteum]
MIPILKQPNEAPMTFNDEKTIITEGNKITRCNLSNCDISNSRLKRSAFENCALSHVRSARWTKASDSHLQNVDSVKRSQISASMVCDGSSVGHSAVTTSNIRNATTIKRSTVANSSISQSKIWRAKLNNCEVENCLIYRTNFEGMILKHGVWKRGKLVSRIGDQEPVAIHKDGSVLKNLSSLDNGLSICAELDAKSQFRIDQPEDYALDSDPSETEDSEDEKDLPPPYKL